MTTETQPEHPVLSDDETNQEKVGARPTPHRVAYKTVLAAVVIGILTISALWVFVIRQEENPANATVVTEPGIQVHEDTAAKETDVARIKDEYGVIDRRLVSMSGRIDRGFESQQTHSSDVKRNLTAIAESLQTIKTAIADLEESNQELNRRISEATSRLDALVKNVRSLKVVKRKSVARHKPRPVKIPPFHIDAIDMWDDVTYVAVSQAGRVAFLKPGEQQSGWTVTHIDRIKGQVAFRGPAGQNYTATLRR